MVNRFVKKSAQAKPDAKTDGEASKMNFTLYQNAYIYYFNMMSSNTNHTFLNYGDLYRIKKYN